MTTVIKSRVKKNNIDIEVKTTKPKKEPTISRKKIEVEQPVESYIETVMVDSNEAIINGVRMKYDLMSNDEDHYKEIPYKLTYLGMGYPIKTDDISEDVEMSHFWSVGSIVEEVETKLKEEKEMNLDEKYVEVNKIMEVVKAENGNPDALIDYIRLSFAEVFSADGRKIETVQDEMQYIMGLISENDFFTEKQKAKFTAALEKEHKEYLKLAEQLEDTNNETIEEIKKSHTTGSSDSDIGMYALAILSLCAVVGIAYMAYRHFEPADVIIDMSTMDIMGR